MTHVAKCSCGQLSLAIEGEIGGVSLCHCVACQRRTGSAFGAQTRVAKARATVAGESTTWRRVPEEGGWVDFRFCPRCGATVYWEIDDLPGDYIVALGAFSDDDLAFRGFPAPTFSVYRDHKHPWVTIPDSVTEDWA